MFVALVTKDEVIRVQFGTSNEDKNILYRFKFMVFIYEQKIHPNCYKSTGKQRQYIYEFGNRQQKVRFL